MLSLARALRLSNASRVAFVGAGGKTRALFQAARELAPSLLSTTTHLGTWQTDQADHHLICTADVPLPQIDFAGLDGLALVTGPIEATSERTRGLTPLQLAELRALADQHHLPLLIEADGARQKPLKAPAAHEPAVPGFVDTLVIVAGLSGLGQPLTEATVQHPEIFSALSGLPLGEIVTAEALVKVLTHPEGGLKNIPPQARRLVLLNQADEPATQAQASQMTDKLLAAFQAVVTSSLQKGRVYARREKVAGIILAAGASLRLGHPKQLLDYNGQPFVRVVAQTALAAGLSPVVVVTGANAGAVSATVQALPVQIVQNKAWESGQSSSIQAGIRALAPDVLPTNGSVGAALFLLCDQPQVTPHVIQALVERHATQAAAIVAPLAGDRRANPVLFDRDTFGELLVLHGDVGGRAIFAHHRVDYLPWHDESLLLDVDTEEGYRRLLARGRAE